MISILSGTSGGNRSFGKIELDKNWWNDFSIFEKEKRRFEKEEVRVEREWEKERSIFERRVNMRENISADAWRTSKLFLSPKTISRNITRLGARPHAEAVRHLEPHPRENRRKHVRRAIASVCDSEEEARGRDTNRRTSRAIIPRKIWSADREHGKK